MAMAQDSSLHLLYNHGYILAYNFGSSTLFHTRGWLARSSVAVSYWRNPLVRSHETKVASLRLLIHALELCATTSCFKAAPIKIFPVSKRTRFETLRNLELSTTMEA